MQVENFIDYDALRRRIRLLLLLDGSERAGLSPINVRRLHTYAYLSNVLAPVWNARVFDGSLLKRRAGPFYPALQRDLDRLVGLGLASISDVGHVRDEDGQWRLDGSFALNYELARTALDTVNEFPREIEIRSFLLEIAYALSILSDSEFDSLLYEDPTYSDKNVSYENVVDFADLRDLNYSADLAWRFLPLLDRATPGELLHLFVRHLRRRIGGEGSLR